MGSFVSQDARNPQATLQRSAEQGSIRRLVPRVTRRARSRLVPETSSFEAIVHSTVVEGPRSINETARISSETTAQAQNTSRDGSTSSCRFVSSSSFLRRGPWGVQLCTAALARLVGTITMRVIPVVNNRNGTIFLCCYPEKNEGLCCFVNELVYACTDLHNLLMSAQALGSSDRQELQFLQNHPDWKQFQPPN